MIGRDEVIDVHTHTRPDWTADSAGRLLAAMDRNGVDRVCISSLGDWNHEPPLEKCVKGNRQAAEVAATCPERIIPFCYLSAKHGDRAVEELETCATQFGARGVKLWVACRCSDPRTIPIAEKAAALGLPILIHSFFRNGGNLPGESSPHDVRALALACPQAKLITAHMVTEAFEWIIAAVRDLPNVYVETGGNPPVSGAVERAVETLGADRVLLGSDAPCRSFGNGLGKVLSAGLSDGDREKVLGLNARKLLGLGDRG